MISIKEFNTVIFDCDGVILNSNKIKTNGFYEATRNFGEEEAKELLKFHQQNGGISRNIKFEHFFKRILKRDNYFNDLQETLNKYSSIIENQLKGCQYSKNLTNLRRNHSKQKWLVLSGSNQEELIRILEFKKIIKFFDEGVYGSPNDKIYHLEELKKNNKLLEPIVFFGDSKYDHICAKKFNLDFIFVYNWTEFSDWKNYCNSNKITYIKNLNQLT